MRGGGEESGYGIEDVGKCSEQISATVYNENCYIIKLADGSLISRMERRSRDEILDSQKRDT
jgi:hypothetical protein